MRRFELIRPRISSRAGRAWVDWVCGVALVYVGICAIWADTVWAEGSATEEGTASIRTVELAGLEVSLELDSEIFKVETETRDLGGGLHILTVRWSSDEAAEPPPTVLKWSLPSHDVAGFWSVTAGLQKVVRASWYPSSVKSTAARSAPVFSLFGHDDDNRLTVAVSDALNAVELRAGLMEEDGRIYSEIGLFGEKHEKVRSYEVEIRFDRRSLYFGQALGDVAAWWASFPGAEPAPVPEVATQPMYSTWYSYHQNVSAEALLKEAAIARRLGFRAMIVDDGWQTLDSNRGYAYTGDWKPERIPDMKGFVEALHELDMDILLWYAVPFMGEKAAGFERFQGKFLRYWDGQGAYVLDPRFPEVRDAVVDVYRRAVQDWDLDGFKLDFIARFVADDDTVLEATDGRDMASVSAAADRLMTDILAELRRVKPDVAVEFRQPYVGPLMRKYGNLFRVGDCPNGAVRNRVGSVDLRLLSGDTAVHSDMIMWHPEEAVEPAALQFLNILFSVPQVSVRLAEIPPEHFEMVRFLTSYWIENRDVLLGGAFHARQPLANYPVISARGAEKEIIAVYADQVITLDGRAPSVDVVNAKTGEDVVVRVSEDLGPRRLRARTCTGKVVDERVVELFAGAHVLPVPPSGILSLEPLDRPSETTAEGD